jgi:hypothetical protein
VEKGFEAFFHQTSFAEVIDNPIRLPAQGCQIFLGATGKIYPTTRKYTKCPQFIPNDRKLDLIAIK